MTQTHKDNLALLPDNILTLKPKDVNINVDGEIISLADMEKIFFLSKLNPDASFIASVLKLDVIKVDRIIHSSKFQDTINTYLSEYVNKNVGEGIHELTIRYGDFLKECFISLRTSVGMRIRSAIENDKVLDAKWLNIPTLEKLMKLEFALHGLPVDLKGVVVGHKRSQDKSQDELVSSLKDVQTTLESFKDSNKFSPSLFLSSGPVVPVEAGEQGQGEAGEQGEEAKEIEKEIEEIILNDEGNE
jgi:hypothetical protein